MTEPKTISFVGTTEIEIWLKSWATEDDRSVSYVLRKIIEQEAQRRRSPPGYIASLRKQQLANQ